jgi:uncharacterized protein YbjT (DUF2867 family)
VEIMVFDYEKPETYQETLRNVNKVFFVGYATPTFATHTERFAYAARKAGVSHFVKLSAYGADFAPGFLIAKNHRESEVAVESMGIPYTHLRPNVFMQNLINYHLYTIRNEGRIYLNQGEGKVSFIDVRDVGRAAVQVLTQTGHVNKVYTLTGFEMMNYFEVAKILSRVSGRRITYVPLTEEESRRRAQALGQPDFLVEITMNMDTFGKKDGFSRITNDFTELTGSKPISFIQFAMDYAATFR